MSNFDYNAPAELFPAKVRTGRRIHYRRFDTAAEAIRFAIEETAGAVAFPALSRNASAHRWLHVHQGALSIFRRGGHRSQRVLSLSANELKTIIALTGDGGRAEQVWAKGSHRKSELEQLALNARRAPRVAPN
jgi:hypothetical protein